MSATDLKHFSDTPRIAVFVLINYPQTAGMDGSKLDVLVRHVGLDFT